MILETMFVMIVLMICGIDVGDNCGNYFGNNVNNLFGDNFDSDLVMTLVMIWIIHLVMI